MKNLPGSVVIILLAIFFFTEFTGLTGCANIVPPMGGPRDSLPPLIVSVSPKDSSLNFDARRITFVFNEFVQVDNNIQQTLLITPTPKIPPTVEGRLRTVTVQIKDTLEPNTTYTFNFGNAIKDVNESNPLTDFTYIFSTGPIIDSLTFTGKILVAETGVPDSTLFVWLHKNLEDSAVIKERPRYIARVDKDGNFLFRNLPPGTFALYGIKDDANSKRYLSKSQLFAFSDSPVVVSSNTTPVTLYAYAEPDTGRTPPALSLGARARPTASTDRRLRLVPNLSNDQHDLLDTLIISAATDPFRFVDSSKISLRNAQFEPVTFSVITDTAKKKFSIFHTWQENTQYHLILDKDFAEDTAGKRLLRNDTISFKTKKESEYGMVRLRFPNLDLSKNPVLLMIQNNQVVLSHPFQSKEYYARLVKPGDFELRILYDTNKNGRWDAGEFFKTRRQPERVVPISRRITVKANWDNEVDITL